MCTAIFYKTNNSYFGRNLDLEYLYNETITITPRNYTFKFRYEADIKSHYAIIGTAYVKDGYPLYYDAVNESGLAAAGLNFPYNACYHEMCEGKINVAPFELILYILGKCSNIDEVKKLLYSLNVIDADFSPQLPATPLHWLVSDKESSVVIESVKDGLKIFDNSYNVLTNNPPFDNQIKNLESYKDLSADETDVKVKDEYYSRATGAVGLPGDWSSMSRFAKAVFVRKNSASCDDEYKSVSQFFHMLSSVEMVRGSVKIGDKYDATQYSNCFNLDKGICYYRKYDALGISSVNMYKENLDGDELINYPMITNTDIFQQN